MFLDMDDFKVVNDTLGHSAGDKLLQEVALRIKSCVRESDTVARLGGDEFVVILNAIDSAESAAVVSRKLMAEIGAPCDIEGNRLRMLPSIGIAIYPDHGETERELLRYADEAMYRVKRVR